MTTKEILNLDYTESKNKSLIQKYLRKIKPFSKYEEDIPLDKLERFIHMALNKYNFKINWIHSSCYANDKYIIYTVEIKVNSKGKSEHISAMCIYELFAKLSIKLYSEIKSNKVERRS